MNLYGESGNVKALKRFIERQGVDCEIHFLTLDDKIDFKKYDFYYIGAGNEESEYIILSDLYKYKDDIKSAVEDGKMFLVTGNAMELFGEKIRIKNGKSIEAIGLFNYNAVEADGRLVSDLFYECEKIEDEDKKYFVGFKNCNCNIVNNEEDRLFKFSDNFRYKNFFGMMIVGPVLIRNPYFTNYILNELFTMKGYEYTPYEDTIEFEAYREFVKNFILNRNLD